MARRKMTEEEKEQKRAEQEKMLKGFYEDFESIENDKILKLLGEFDKIGIGHKEGIELLIDKYLNGETEIKTETVIRYY